MQGSLTAASSSPPQLRTSQRRSTRLAAAASSSQQGSVAASQDGSQSRQGSAPVEAAPLPISPSSSTTSRKRNFDRVASSSSSRSTRQPIHWPTYALTKTRFSVTDLVGPSWCEYAFMYGVIGQTHLPVSQRPVHIVTEKGTVIKPDKGKAERQERTKKEGQRIHEKLEREVHPEKVVVRATSREEAWARRFVGAIAAIRSLVDDGCVREMPVFGWIKGKLVTGIIDEIERRETYVEQGSEVEASSATAAPRSTISSKPRASPSKTKAKQWSSQEEWKRDQAKRKAIKDTSSGAGKDLRAFFGSTPSPKKKAPSQRASEVKGEGRKTAARAGDGRDEGEKLEKPAEIKEEPTPSAKPPPKGWGFFLSDAKTRLSATVPLEPAQKAARLQVMLYKRLVDGLVAGALLTSEEQSSKILAEDAMEEKDKTHLAVDEEATPVYLPALYAQLDLDQDVPLGEDFMTDVRPLLESWHISLPSADGGGSQAESPSSNGSVDVGDGGTACTLSHLGEALTAALLDLASSAKAGQAQLGLQSEEGRRAHIIQPELTLVYRLQEQRGKFRRREKKLRTGAGDKVSEGGNEARRTPSASPASSRGHPPTPNGSQNKSAALDGREIGTTPLASQGASTQGSASVLSTPTSSLAPSRPRAAAQIIGRVAFPHDPTSLSAHLDDVLGMWAQERELRGVSEDETWRCGFCAFREGCEWRERKGRERLEWWERRRGGGGGEVKEEVDVEEMELWGLEMDVELEDLDEGGELESAEAVSVSLLPRPSQQQTGPADGNTQPSKQEQRGFGGTSTQEEEDDALWLHFEEDEEWQLHDQEGKELDW